MRLFGHPEELENMQKILRANLSDNDMFALIQALQAFHVAYHTVGLLDRATKMRDADALAVIALKASGSLE